MPEEKNYFKWDLSHVQHEFNIDSDVVLPKCEWKERKLDIFTQMLEEIEDEEENSK